MDGRVYVGGEEERERAARRDEESVVGEEEREEAHDRQGGGLPQTSDHEFLSSSIGDPAHPHNIEGDSQEC